jgi:UDP-N-acetylglucosamine 3-dehydrogenase
MAGVNVGVIGVGWFGEIHCNTLAGLPNVTIRAIADRDETRLAEVAKTYGVAAVHTAYADLLNDPAIDAVHIVTRWDTHAEIAIAALEAGKHVLLEKPMAPTLEECAAICAAARRAKGNLMVGHVCRFNPRFIAAKREIAAGKIGRVVSLNARRNVPAAWAEGALDKVNPISDTGIHDTDLMLWLADARVVSAYAQTVRIRDFVYPEILHIMYRFETGATAIYESAWAMPDSAPFVIDERMAIIGDAGFVHVQDTAPNLGVCTKDGYAGPDTTYWPSLNGTTGGALRDEVMYFIQCIAEGRAPTVITPEQSMEAMRTVLAAEESAASGAIVRLD